MTQTKRRVFLISALLVAASAIAFIAYGNLGDNLVYYWEPTDLVEQGDNAYGKSVRLGGFVKKGTVQWNEDELIVEDEIDAEKSAIDDAL